MTRCYATCDVSSSHDSYVTGGLLGTIWDGQLSYCFATGNVSGHSGVGGLMAGTNDATVSNCYATGNVSGVESVGGLMGDMWHSPAYIVNCYSTGRVSGSINVGGLIGVRYEGRVSNSFWDIQTSGRTRSAGGTGKTTAQMQSRSTYETAGWDFITPIWTIENDDYPRLGWQWQPKTIYVPAEYPTIQDAIDATFYQDTIIVAPGAYTGDGNRDIDFKGKEITVRSTDPNDPDIVAATIIDCQGTEVEPHRGFYFNNAESLSSKLMGFTITNGYADKGGAIYCSNGGPEIYKCTITNCSAEYGGGIWTGYGYPFSEPGIINCNIIGNSSRQNCSKQKFSSR